MARQPTWPRIGRIPKTSDAVRFYHRSTYRYCGIYRPPNEKPTISFLAQAKRVGQKYELETEDAIYRFGSAAQFLVEGLNINEETCPGTHEKFATHMKRSKRAVARVRAELYDNPHPDSHSAELKSGYFVATNNKDQESRAFIREAAEIAGLKWEKNFVVRKCQS